MAAHTRSSGYLGLGKRMGGGHWSKERPCSGYFGGDGYGGRRHHGVLFFRVFVLTCFVWMQLLNLPYLTTYCFWAF